MDKTKITIQTYDDTAKAFETKFMDLKLYQKSLTQLMRYLSPNDKVLDLGCGPGNVARFILDREVSLEIIGIDLSVEMVKLAKINVPQAQFEVADIRQIQYTNDTFDLVIASFCLPFLYDSEAVEFIEKIARFLKPCGRLYLSTMEGSGHRFETPSFAPGQEMFFNYYSEVFLREQFIKNQLEVIDFDVQDYPNNDGTVLKDLIFVLQKNYHRERGI